MRLFILRLFNLQCQSEVGQRSEKIHVLFDPTKNLLTKVVDRKDNLQVQVPSSLQQGSSKLEKR